MTDTTFFENKVKRRLRNKERLSGAWVHSGSPVTAGIIAEAGFDVALIDLEHSPAGINELLPMILAMKGTECVPFVRVPWNDMAAVKKALDCGACGIHIPFVCTKEEAENAVRYCKYPPMGVRGAAGCTNAARYGLKRNEYFSAANREGIVMVAIETPEGAEAVDEFLAIEGVDGIFIGPSDLGASMGRLNEKADEVEAVIRRIEDKVRDSGKFLATIAGNVEEAKNLYDRGYNLVIMMSDLVDLAKLAAATVKAFQETCR